MTAPLHALVLAGGRSTRMKRDKAALEYLGRPQLEQAFALAREVAAEAFVGVRADQRDDPLRSRFPLLADAPGLAGPIAGIRAAQQHAPDVAWLVLACDLPFLGATALRGLVAARDPSRDATAYRSAHDGLPEPLCAIYEPRSAAKLATFVASGRDCPRKFLLNADTLLIEPHDARALDNVNSTEEYFRAMQDLHPGDATEREIRVQYFAILREQARRSDETLRTRARTPSELYAELAARHRFTLPASQLRVAVNGEFGDWQQPLAERDELVFIPPVAGG